MSAKIIDGEAVAEQIRQQVAREVRQLVASGIKPSLAAVQVGENPASKIYTNMQAKACEAVGIEYKLITLPETTSQEELLEEINRLNHSDMITGIILQMPLPQQIDARAVQMEISPMKDVEGVHPQNMGKLFYGGGTVAPCTPMAVVELIKRTCNDQGGLAGKEVVIVGHSEIVGKPIAAILLQSPDAAPTVTVCHIATRDLTFHTRRAEILIVATGVSQARWLRYKQMKQAGENPPPPDLSPLIKADMIKDGAIVIDVAINRIPKGFDENGEPIKNEKGKIAMQTVGDVDFQAACEKASAITPVPGGVGPVTTAMLLANTVACTKESSKKAV